MTITELADRYVVETEAFDTTVCTWVTDGGIAMPRTGKEAAAINTFARKLNAECAEKARILGFSEEDWKRARIDAIRRFTKTSKP